MDEVAGYIQKKLIDTGLDKRVNVIHVSDHGMNSVSPPNFINLTEHCTTHCTIYGTSPVLQIIPNDFGLYLYIKFDNNIKTKHDCAIFF